MVGRGWGLRRGLLVAVVATVALVAPSAGAVDPWGHIAGRVTDSQGNPLEDICVDAYDLEEEWYWGGVTDPTGSYLIEELDPGSYKVLFEDCAWWGREEGEYVSEWYDDKPGFASAATVSVTAGRITTGINATLALQPFPDLAVTNLSVEDVPPPLLGEGVPGWERLVHVDLANLGQGVAEEAVVQAQVCFEDETTCELLGYADLTDVAPGETLRRSFEWDGLGMVGDFAVLAQVCVDEDEDFDNNGARVDHYVLVEGTGFGVRAGILRQGDAYDYPVEC